jgi:DNA-binding transcriptional LysR family regulator
MNLGQLEVLVAIADTGSLTEAGEQIGLTQSAVSYSLSKLEAELGVTLLERGRQGIILSRIGAEVVHYARSILAQIEVIHQKTAHERGLSIGKLRFGCVPTIPPRLLTGIIRDFKQHYPKIELVIFEGTPQELIDWLTSGVIDVGTVVESHSYALTAPLVNTEMKAILYTDHPLADAPYITLDQLITQSLIGPKTEYGILNHMRGIKNLFSTRLRHEVSTQNTIYAMIREKMGISVMPDVLIDTHIEDTVILPLYPPINLHIYLASNIASPANEAFLNLASHWAREHGFLPDNP